MECAYEAIKPRQRRKRDSQSSFGIESPLECLSLREVYDWQDQDRDQGQGQDQVGTPCESEYLSPIETKLDITPLSSHILNDIGDYSSSPYYETEIDDGDSQNQLEVVRREPYRRATSSARSRSPELAMIAPCPVGSPTLEFCMPSFSEFSSRPNRRALVDHFCNVLSHLIVFREESGNPFQQLVLPLSHHSSPVMNAIYALASAHLEYRGVQNTEKSLYFHNQAIQGLARVIENQKKVNKNELLAAIMLLVYYEVVWTPKSVRRSCWGPITDCC